MAEVGLVDHAALIRQAVEAENAASVTRIGSSWLYRSEMRLDAGNYDSVTMEAYRRLELSGLALKRLAEVTARIFIPPRFKRIYVDPDHGVPFLQGTNLPQFKLTDIKYLSRSVHKNLDPWMIEPGWVLVTCSGTIGRVGIALRQWAGWAASQHILRVVPQQGSLCPAGYIYAWLSSPLGQAQFNGVYGAVVDEITAEHVENILIPVPSTKEQQTIVDSIDRLAVQSLEAKELALAHDISAVQAVGQLFNKE